MDGLQDTEQNTDDSELKVQTHFNYKIKVAKANLEMCVRGGWI